MASTAEERSTAAQIAALTRWAKTDDRSAGTRNARQKWREKLAREVDPDGVMPVVEVERRVDALVKAHMLRMSLKAQKSRRQAREARERAKQLDVIAAETEQQLAAEVAQ